MSECSHNCETCEQNCSERKESFLEKPNRNSNIKKVIGIVSGKGGVGKSLVTSLLAAKTAAAGKKTRDFGCRSDRSEYSEIFWNS